MSNQQDLFDRIDKIEINNTKETVTINGQEFSGEDASSCAWLIRIATQKILNKKIKCEPRGSWASKMVGLKS